MFEEFLSKLSNDPENWVLRAEVIREMLKAGERDKAVEVLSSAEEFPTYGEQLSAAAYCYRLIDPNYGIEILDMVIASDPTNAVAYLEKSKIQLKLNNPNDGLLCYNQAINIDNSLVDEDLEAKLNPNIDREKDILTNQDSVANDISNQSLENKESQKVEESNNVNAEDKGKAGSYKDQISTPKTSVEEKFVTTSELKPISAYNIDELAYPDPGSFPTMSVSDIVEVKPLVDPNSHNI